MLPVAFVGSGPSNSRDMSTVNVPPCCGFSAGAAVDPVVALAMPPTVAAGPRFRPAMVGVVLAFTVVADFAAVVPVTPLVVDVDAPVSTAVEDVSARLVAVSLVDVV